MRSEEIIAGTIVRVYLKVNKPARNIFAPNSRMFIIRALSKRSPPKKPAPARRIEKTGGKPVIGIGSQPPEYRL
jgi:hypothetical protein